MDGVRVFTIEEANALVPRLSELVGAQLEVGDEIQTLVGQLWEEQGARSTPRREGHAEVIDVTVYPDDGPAISVIKESLAAAVKKYRDGWSAVEATGAIIKDTTTGLLDFYGKIDDRLVWLCWQYGEDSVAWYHELDAGFAGRKSLADIKKRMLN